MHRAEEEGSDSLISGMLCPSPARSSLLQASDTESHEHACLLVVFGVFTEYQVHAAETAMQPSSPSRLGQRGGEAGFAFDSDGVREF